MKLYDIHDIALSLASLNAERRRRPASSSTSASGRAQDFDGKDVKGKFVLVAVDERRSAAALRAGGRSAARSASSASAPSASSARSTIPIRSSRPRSTPAAGHGGVERVARRRRASCAAMLARGEKITIRSIVKSAQVPTRSEIVHAEIPGDGSTTQEVAIGGHLYEGVIKQGANDDNSGCALTLEIGRAYIKLINEGKLPRPKRTINFLWVPEISGTNAWLNAHPDKAKAHHRRPELRHGRRSASTESRSYWILQRTPDTFPSYLNDIAQSMMEYVADVSRERVRYRANGYAPAQPIVVAERQRRRVLHQDRQALRLERSRHLHAARHSGGDVHHVARHVVPLVAGHARQAGLRRSTSARPSSAPARWRCSRRAPTRWPRACSTRTSAAASRGWASRTRRASATWPTRRRAGADAGLQGSASSPSSIRPRSRRASCDRRASCGRTSTTARRRSAVFEPLIDQRARRAARRSARGLSSCRPCSAACRRPSRR